MRICCDCAEGARGSCAHALSAIDEALDLLRVPSLVRDRLASILATPIWTRFLQAFGDELGHRARRPDENVRPAWRIRGEATRVEVEPLLQKRLKGVTRWSSWKPAAGRPPASPTSG